MNQYFRQEIKEARRPASWRLVPSVWDFDSAWAIIWAQVGGYPCRQLFHALKRKVNPNVQRLGDH